MVSKERFLTEQGNRELEQREVAARRLRVRAIQEYLGLSDVDIRKISRKDLRTMTKKEFEAFINDFESRATQLVSIEQAKNELMDLLRRKEFKKWENARQALKLPAIDKMTEEQLQQFTNFLEQFQTGDEFLSVRKLETVDRTDLQGIHTLREARERLAKQLGVAVNELENIKVGELDRFRYDTALADRNPFYKMLVDETNKAVLNGEALFLETKKEFESLLSKALASHKQTVSDKLIPQQKNIIAYLEAPVEQKAIVAEQLTPAEIDLANFLQNSRNHEKLQPYFYL